MDRTNDAVKLCGEVAGPPVLSHTGRDGVYYKFPLAVRRLSGAEDVINIVVSESKLRSLELEDKPCLALEGEVRSYNNRSGTGPRLVITVLARELSFTQGEHENRVALTGTVCREPTLRRTPMGREISDIMLAVGRGCGRSDYIPCIAWGAVARRAARWPVGTVITVTGRIQSRAYIKLEDGVPVEKTAYEISAVTAEPAGEQ